MSESGQTIINALSSKAKDYRKLVPVRLKGHTVLALVDSGNSFYNAISLAVAKRIGLSDFKPYDGPPVGTAQTGSHLDIVGIANRTPLSFQAEEGNEVKFMTKFIIVQHLSCGINLSLPFLVDNGLDQLHSVGKLRLQSRNLHFTLYRDRKHALTTVTPEPQTINAITVSDAEAKVYSTSRFTVPPKTGQLVDACIKTPVPITKATDSVFSYDCKFLNKMQELQINGPQGENYLLGLNAIDQAVTIGKSNTLRVRFFNDSEYPITISNNSFIGMIAIPEPPAVAMDLTNVMTISSEDAPLSPSMGNTPSSELKTSNLAERREYVYKTLGVDENPVLSDNAECANELASLLLEFWDVFYREGNCGGTAVLEHPVYTPKGLPPIRLKNRPINPGLIDELKEQIATWLKDGVIRSGGVSPWNFPLLPVRKKSGKWRWVVDFRQLNSVTRKDSFPIPNIVELLSYLRRSKYFTSLDLAQAFHSIPVREIDREKLSFCALDKFYQFCRMPFGLTSAPNTWARLVTHVLHEIPKDRLIVFFDDLLVHSHDLETHLSTIKRVMELLRESGLRLNMEKTDWVKDQVKFLGHIISDKGISVPPEFTAIIKEWPLPETLKQLRSFLGKCNYYRNHFKEFAIVASPLMAHLKGPSESSRKLNLHEDPKAVESFESLKKLLMSPQLLAYPDFDNVNPFIIDTDYSNEGIGTVLSQVQNGVERPISFNARRLKTSESQYASHKGELLALIFAIDTYKFFLTGRKFLVRTDNSALTWLKNQKDPKGILMRWLRIISAYDFDIEHRAGTKHANADALSRTTHAPFMTPHEVETILNDDQILAINEPAEDEDQTSSDSEANDYDSDDRVDPRIDEPEEFPIPEGLDDSSSFVTLQRSDPLLSKVIKWMKDKHKPTGQEYKLLSSAEKFYVDLFEFLEFDSQGLLVRRPLPFTGDKDYKIAVPESAQELVLYSLHHKNHAGGNALASSVQLKYFFPRLVSACREFVFKCARCQRLTKKKSQRHTYAYDIVGSPGEKVCLDFVGPLKPTRQGHTSLLTILDVYTRWFHAWPVKNQKADTVIKHLIKDYIPARGVPSVVHSDNGPAFIAHVFQVAMNQFDVRNTTTPVYNPKSNSVERFHRTMKRKLTALIHEFDNEWDEALPATLLAMRTSVNRTTGFTPFFLEHGREARLPVDLIAGSPPDQSISLDRYTEKMKEHFTKAFSTVTERQKSYILRQQELYRERHHKINVDDLVWLYTDRPNPNLNRKFQSFWSGPYRVLQQLSNTIYKIESYGRWSRNVIVVSAAVDRLKKCYVNDPDTNLGIPVDITARDVRPYFENQELLGRIPIADFAPHTFYDEDELPHSAPRDDNDERPMGQYYPSEPDLPPVPICFTDLPVRSDTNAPSSPESSSRDDSRSISPTQAPLPQSPSASPASTPKGSAPASPQKEPSPSAPTEEPNAADSPMDAESFRLSTPPVFPSQGRRKVPFFAPQASTGSPMLRPRVPAETPRRTRSSRYDTDVTMRDATPAGATAARVTDSAMRRVTGYPADTTMDYSTPAKRPAATVTDSAMRRVSGYPDDDSMRFTPGSIYPTLSRRRERPSFSSEMRRFSGYPDDATMTTSTPQSESFRIGGKSVFSRLYPSLDDQRMHHALPFCATPSTRPAKGTSVKKPMPLLSETIHEEDETRASPHVVSQETPAPPPAKRGRPKGAKTRKKECSNCIAFNTCVQHCLNCRNKLPCTKHSDSQRCSKCTLTRFCPEHRV